MREPLADMPADARNAPSLFALALRRLQATHDLSSFPATGYSASISSAVRRARAAVETGGEACAGCGKTVLVKRAEWVEWWRDWSRPDREERGWGPASEEVVPVSRVACRWECARVAHRYEDVSKLRG